MTTKTIKKRAYIVRMDVFFMETRHVEARNKKEAFQKARELVNHGMGEEVSLFEIEEDTYQLKKKKHGKAK